ncbi:uncharacterized protein LOC112048336 [Bicyclus anynana]|uniref:Uncharacterized protein LOC112048336 n=1 Tax=Bicyclus anynana TaxID=110368 RepID=A0A6J1N925_BICAN|nr:uncharacterized protein LOC112048336 [Bicyclus anynana]
MKTGLLYGIVANSKTRVRCVFCGVYIPKANKCIEEHTNGMKHKENIDLMSENGLTYYNDELYCKPCDVYLTGEDSVAAHLEGEQHANWVAAMDDLIEGEFINIDAYLSTESEEVFCEVCNMKVNCTLQNIEEHVNDILHRSNVAEKLKPLNGIFPVENDDELWCKVCDEYIENTARSLLEHIDDDKQHVEWFMDIEDLIEDQEISIQDYLKNEHEKKAFCNKCQVEIPCNARSLEEHVHSEAHLNQFS